MESTKTEVWPGQAYPLGATYDGIGTNFTLFSEEAIPLPARGADYFISLRNAGGTRCRLAAAAARSGCAAAGAAGPECLPQART